MQSVASASLPKVIIVGGGIGGLTAALALLKRGIDVEVYEQSAMLKEVGAGVQLGSNGTRVLYALGLRDALDRALLLSLIAKSINSSEMSIPTTRPVGPTDAAMLSHRKPGPHPMSITRSPGVKLKRCSVASRCRIISGV